MKVDLNSILNEGRGEETKMVGAEVEYGKFQLCSQYFLATVIEDEN